MRAVASRNKIDDVKLSFTLRGNISDVFSFK